jgi:uncharacterized protein
VDTPRWFADEMVGRLARYLRFVGCDTAYERGLSDDEVIAKAATEDRVVLTRDRALARRAGRSLLLSSPALATQWHEVARAYPGLPHDVSFSRCTLCNGVLVPAGPSSEANEDPTVPWSRVRAGLPLYRCTGCAHLFWEGSHTARVRATLRTWTGAAVP